jgi:hypothetical protein
MTEATHWEIGAVKITRIVEVSWGSARDTVHWLNRGAS